MNLEQIKDMCELWGYKVDRDYQSVRASESDEDYVVVYRKGDSFLVEVYDTPATILRDLGSFLHGCKEPTQIVLVRPSTKKRKYGR